MSEGDRPAPRKRIAVRASGWTKARRKRFLDTLASTCNVREACRVVGKAVSGAYVLRQRDPEFGRLWQVATDIGAARLEDELMACALGHGTSGDNPADGPQTAEEIRIDPKLAMEILKFRAAELHRQSPRVGRVVAATPAEIDLALTKRLDALAARVRK